MILLCAIYSLFAVCDRAKRSGSSNQTSAANHDRNLSLQKQRRDSKEKRPTTRLPCPAPSIPYVKKNRLSPKIFVDWMIFSSRVVRIFIFVEKKRLLFIWWWIPIEVILHHKLRNILDVYNKTLYKWYII